MFFDASLRLARDATAAQRAVQADARGAALGTGDMLTVSRIEADRQIEEP